MIFLARPGSTGLGIWHRKIASAANFPAFCSKKAETTQKKQKNPNEDKIAFA